MLKCKNCNSCKLKYDSITDMYLCEKCNHLLSRSELSSDKNNPEELDGFSITVLNLVQSIPIVGIIIPVIVNKANVKKSYKKYFSYRLVSQIILFCLLTVIFVFFFVDYKHAYQKSLISGMNAIVSHALYRDEVNISIPDMSVGNYIELIDKVNETKHDDLLSDDYALFDDCIMSGSKVRNLIYETSEHGIAYLVQTKGLVSTHGSDVYLNIGRVLTGYILEDESLNYIITKQDSYSYLKNNNEYAYASTDIVKDSKGMGYISENREYRFNILCDNNDAILGFMFTEVKN